MRIDRRWAGLMVLATMAVAGCGDDDDEAPAPVVPSGAPTEAAASADEWPAPNYDYANTRNVQGARISSENVAELGPAWSIPIEATGTFGGYASTPIIADNVAYVQDLESNVKALDIVTGEVLWERDFDSTNIGPNGLTIGYGKVFGATTTFAFALDAETGKEAWRSRELVRNENEGIDMAPAAFEETVYVSTVPGNADSFYAGDGVGILWALDANTGKPRWSFNTVPNDLWDREHKDINSGGGLWHPPAFDEQGDLYIDVANPGPWPGTEEFPWGESRPGPNLYTNSIVKLSADGERIWHQQVLPHDIYDWDLQLPPVLAETDDGTEVALAAGKLGYVYAIDRESGDVVWERSVGRHNGHDTDNETVLAGGDPPELPLELYPGILGGVETQMAVSDGVVFAPVVNLPTTFDTQEKYDLPIDEGTGEMVALDLSTGEQLWSTEFEQPPYGAATVVNDLVFTTIFSGELVALDIETGEIVWRTQMPAGTNATIAVSGGTILTAASYALAQGESPQVIAYRLGASGGLDQEAEMVEEEPAPEEEEAPQPEAPEEEAPEEEPEPEPEPAPAADGESIFTENCASCHTLAAAGAAGTVGPSLDELDLDVAAIQEQVENGGGGMPAFGDTLSPEEISAVAEYVAGAADPTAEAPSGPGGGP